MSKGSDDVVEESVRGIAEAHASAWDDNDDLRPGDAIETTAEALRDRKAVAEGRASWRDRFPSPADTFIPFVKHDDTKLQWHLLPPNMLEGIVEVLMHGAKKYDAFNWRRGASWSRYWDAAQRHLTAWWAGEEDDPDSSFHHLDHAICCLLFLREFAKMPVDYSQYDDRRRLDDPTQRNASRPVASWLPDTDRSPTTPQQEGLVGAADAVEAAALHTGVNPGGDTQVAPGGDRDRGAEDDRSRHAEGVSTGGVPGSERTAGTTEPGEVRTEHRPVRVLPNKGGTGWHVAKD